MTTWTTLTEFGTLLSGDTNAPTRVVGALTDSQRFFRALRTEGLYDTSLLRTVSLTFTQSNWQTLLANGRTTGSNTLCTLEMDNGAVLAGVGARYRGNTSYTGMGPGGAPTKKSVNLELDYTNTVSSTFLVGILGSGAAAWTGLV